MTTTSWACDSFSPAAEIRTNFAVVRSASMSFDPVSPIPLRSPPVSWWTRPDSDPLKGTIPSIPSGTSFDSGPPPPLSGAKASSAVSWK